MKKETLDNKERHPKGEIKTLYLEYILLLQQVLREYEVILLQELGYMFADNSIVDFYFKGINRHILISDNFETPNFEVMINPNGYISITDDDSTVCYQVATGTEIKLPYIRGVIDFDWNELEAESMINSFTSEADIHRFIELLEVEVVMLKQRLWVLKNSLLKLELVEDEKFIKEFIALREVS